MAIWITIGIKKRRSDHNCGLLIDRVIAKSITVRSRRAGEQTLPEQVVADEQECRLTAATGDRTAFLCNANTTKRPIDSVQIFLD